ncbi:MAG: putative lipid II flippase FtsW [Candidatus Levybacteria bacterium]|nr:putative lipid II flippase FtsW [Candidatus Levybacteria bacterium]
MKHFDIILFSSVAVLSGFGLLMIFEASSFVAFRDFSDKYYYIKDQSVWIVLGFIGLLFFSMFDYHKLYILALPLLLAALVLLILVFIPGIGVAALGARRWINLGFFVLQPAEFVKLALSIYLAAWFSSKEKGRLFAFLLLLGVVIALIMLEPDMGTAGIILAEAIVIYFVSGANILTFLLFFPIMGFLGYLLIILEPYRAARLNAFLTPQELLTSSSYHVKQILIALGMGGLTGVGLGNSLQKYAYLPENTTDSIFAIIAEELGFVGSSIVIFLLMVVVWRGLTIASHAKDQFGKLLAAGITTFLGVQTLINLGAQTVLFPVTGVPLPFISYGGSALIVDMCAIGVLLNIARFGRQNK